ncbi:MAG: hypothetical protein HY791_19400 [Deltaproteobacteria bacterium]|nr:hypothetical protein [Deltaproteobacteria bacterium]
MPERDSNAVRVFGVVLSLLGVACTSDPQEPPARRLKDTGVHEDAASDAGFLDAAPPPDSGFPTGCSTPQTVTLVENPDLPMSMEASFLWNQAADSCVLVAQPGPDTLFVFAAIQGRLTASHGLDSGWSVTEVTGASRSRPYQVSAIPYDTEIRIRSQHTSATEVETKLYFTQADGTVTVSSFLRL